jgi:hypothetical protein
LKLGDYENAEKYILQHAVTYRNIGNVFLERDKDSEKYTQDIVKSIDLLLGNEALQKTIEYKEIMNELIIFRVGRYCLLPTPFLFLGFPLKQVKLYEA